jgi:hypothetical protein
MTLFGPNLSDKYYETNHPIYISRYALSVAATVPSTLLIIVQILIVLRMPGASHRPLTALEIVVESAALYSVSALVLLALVVRSDLETYYQTVYLCADEFFNLQGSKSPHLVVTFLDRASVVNTIMIEFFASAMILLRVVPASVRARPEIEGTGNWSVRARPASEIEGTGN